MTATLLPPSADLLARAAAGIVAQHRAALPDLSSIVVLLPTPAPLRALRRQIARAAGGALLGPQILTLSAFAAQHARERAASALDCRLLLARELENYTHLFAGQDALALADELYALFEQLSAQSPELANDERRFLARIEQAYGARLDGISREAGMVHTLWRAFLQQTEGRSPAVANARALQAAFAAPDAAAHIHLVGFDSVSASEAAAVRAALAAQRATLWLHGRTRGRDGAALAALCTQLHIEPAVSGDDTDARGHWLDRLFDDDGTPLRTRIANHPTAHLPHLQAAGGPEHEARIADLAIRQWLLAGHRDIAVVAQDRRYARRLRALLERAQVPLRDEVGWALSTSAAAASLAHWLDVCEHGFPHAATLALLKSAFHDPGRTQRKAVEALERAIRERHVSAGLARLMSLGDEAYALLAPLETPAHKLRIGAGARPAHYWCEDLLASLRLLPLWTQWQHDDAGLTLSAALEELHAALQRSGLRLGWADFRRLLERTLERATFSNVATGGGVRLLTLDQTHGLRCDALILAGAGAGQFPGKATAPALFNHSVRAELGLPHWGSAQQLALTRFRLLMQAAAEVLITWAPEDDGEPAQPCTWVEAMHVAGAPGAEALASLARSGRAEIADASATLPAAQRRPAPASAAALLPASLSAGAHQRLIDCPYQFHAADVLRLRAPQDIDEPYSARDFGERVHEILARFLDPVARGDEAQAALELERLAHAAFAPDLRARALAQAWLARFIALIPMLVDWLAERGALWPRAQAEVELQREAAPGLRLHGRIDRLETAADGAQCVVDYKTGIAPSLSDVENGESVQATHYALLAEACTQVEYLLLSQDASQASRALSGEALDDTRQGVRARLVEIHGALHGGAALPAHGDDDSCARCDHAGLCRKGAWADV